ncbi:MAG: hypothetical protein CME65_15990 [Halobacteriovoraceae bacterium]|nr:hypothetical protein [Halobacteriovoraceae bacterium]
MNTIMKLLTMTLFISQAVASEVYISDVNLIGNGCSDEDTFVVLSPDEKKLSLLFENFFIDSSIGGRSTVARKSCDMQISISVPRNKRVAIKKIDYRGYAYIPTHSSIRFMSGHSLEVPAIGYKTREYRDQIIKEGFLDQDLYLEQYVNNRLTEASCGHDVVLHVTSKLFANMHNDELFAAIDSADSGIDYHMEYEDCYPTRQPSAREIQAQDTARRRVQAAEAARQAEIERRRQLSCLRDPRCRAATINRETRGTVGRVERAPAPRVERNTRGQNARGTTRSSSTSRSRRNIP